MHVKERKIEYTRNDGKSFNDPVIDLYGRGLLLIHERSVKKWKIKFEAEDIKTLVLQNEVNTVP